MRRFCVTLLLLLVCLLCIGETYTTISSTNPGHKFETESSWVNSLKPGTYNKTDKVFYTTGNSDVVINGYVALDGTLELGNDAFLSGSQLTIKSNSILVINGDLKISDRTDVVIEEGATIYIKGNLITVDKSSVYSYVEFDIKKNANIVVEGNVTSTNNASVGVNFENGANSDFYVFGTVSGTIYRRNGSSFGIPKYKDDGNSRVENESQYDKNETILSETVDIIVDEIINDCKTLKIPSGSTITISNDVEYCNIVFGDENSKLIIENEGRLSLTNDVVISKGQLINYGVISSENDITIYPRMENGVVACKFNNNGIIKSDNFIMGSSSEYGKKSSPEYFSFSCGSGIVANNIEFYLLRGIQLDGNFVTDKMIIDSQNGGDEVNFGSTCGTSEINIKELTLKNNISEININEITGLEKVNAQTYSTVKMDVNGSLVIGETTGQMISFVGNDNSIITLCYNPTHMKYEWSKGDFSGNGVTSSTSGTVIYRYDKNDNEHSWYTDGTIPSNNPHTEEDILCNGCKLSANDVSFAECMEGVTIILGMEYDPFLPKEHKEIKSIHTFNPCDEKYKKTKIRIRELNNMWFRFIGGELFYCENDNF